VHSFELCRAGANLTDKLKRPDESIPKGTAWAIIFCSVVYIIVIVICGVCMGVSVPVLRFASFVRTCLFIFPVVRVKLLQCVLSAIAICCNLPWCTCAQATATRATLADFVNVDFEGLISAWSPLVIQGIYSAALSTSVGMPSAWQMRDVSFVCNCSFSRPFWP
jgi:amino acid transporter